MWLIFIHDCFGRSVPADSNVSGHVILQAIFLGGRSCLAERYDITPERLYEDGKCQPCRRANALMRARCRTSLFDRPMTMMLFESVVRPLG
jgi:hypothetical protein